MRLLMFCTVIGVVCHQQWKSTDQQIIQHPTTVICHPSHCRPHVVHHIIEPDIPLAFESALILVVNCSCVGVMNMDTSLHQYFTYIILTRT